MLAINSLIFYRIPSNTDVTIAKNEKMSLIVLVHYALQIAEIMI